MAGLTGKNGRDGGIRTLLWTLVFGWLIQLDFVCNYDASLPVISISSHYILAVKLMPDPVIFTVL